VGRTDRRAPSCCATFAKAVIDVELTRLATMRAAWRYDSDAPGTSEAVDAAVRTARIAPVSRAMILDDVAQHTLGMARSY